MQSAREFYEMLDQSQWWPAEQLVAWQRRHLHLLLTHARATVPFYNFRLRNVVRANGSIDWDRWHDIPILTRADVMKHFDSLLSRAPIPEHGPFQDVQSSGSTGHPVTTRATRWLMDMGAACNWRTHQWAGLDWSKTLVTTIAPEEHLTVGDDLGPWGPPWLPASRRGRSLYTNYHTDFNERLELIGKTRATYLATTSFTAENLGRRARLLGSGVRLAAILARGGAVSDQLRAEMRETFGAETVEFYSSKEAGAIGARCPSGSGYHVNAETMLFEVVDDDGRPVAPGEKGRVVVTPFASTALPLIRYDQGDIVVAGSTCSCGRSLPHFHEISGRERVEFRHPDGRRRDAQLTQACYEMIGAGLVQIAQVGPRQFEVRYVPHNWGVPRNEAAFAQAFRELVFEDSEVTLVELPEMPASRAGKFRASVIEWDGAS